MSPRLVCYYCGIGCQIIIPGRRQGTPKNGYTIDHVFPSWERKEMKKEPGWRYSQTNFTLPACYGCNQARDSTTFLEFISTKENQYERTIGRNQVS